MVTNVTARLGLVAGLAALVVGMPTGAAAATRAAQVKPIGDHCLVGTWRARPSELPVEFHHKLIEMHFGGGDYLHLNRKGNELDNWDQSRLIESFPDGFDLKLHNRGRFYAQVRGLEGTSEANGNEIHAFKVTGGHWGAGSYLRATYNGKPVKFRFTSFRAHYSLYTCSKTALIMMDPFLNVHQTYSRRSYTP
ncbi:MAG TPA: hypothetical protein VHV76_00855 [Mycobacteriales bacterium]|jgi:hypothetical protein|nr:hypothetical protein [Mycobacteriales bacterium]